MISPASPRVLFENPQQSINDVKEGKKDLQPLTEIFHAAISSQTDSLETKVDGLMTYGNLIEAKRFYFHHTVKGGLAWFFKSVCTLSVFNHVLGSLPKAEKTFHQDALKLAKTIVLSNEPDKWNQLAKLLTYLKFHPLGEEVRKDFFEDFSFEDVFLTKDNLQNDNEQWGTIFLDAQGYMNPRRENLLIANSFKKGFFCIYAAMMFQVCNERPLARDVPNRQAFLRSLTDKGDAGIQNGILIDISWTKSWEWMAPNKQIYTSAPYNGRTIT